MPRAPRRHAPGLIHHVTMRGVQSHPLFSDEQDRWRFLGLLSDVTRECDWRCLLVEEGEAPLSKPMRLLNSGYANAANRRHDRIGHLFAGRYGDRHVTSDAHLAATVAYIARNPCEAGMCVNAEDWPWSSYGALVGVGRPWSFVSAAHLRSLLSVTPEVLRQLVIQGSDPGKGSGPWATPGGTRR